MRPGYVGNAIKHANTPEDAAKLLGKYDKKQKIIIDGRGNVLSNVTIDEET
jgi:hypothetical protein